MKKTIYAAVLFLTIGIAATSCKKDNTPKTKTENPAKATIEAKLVVDTSLAFATGSWEFGNKFYVSKNGNITKLGCKMPDAGSFRVSLWDFSTQNLIAATTVTITDTSKFVYNAVSPIAITANTRYLISTNNTSGGVAKRYFVYFKKPSASTPIYPFTTGSVTYETLQEKGSTTSVFPDGVPSVDRYYFIGVPDFQFEYTE